MESLNELPNILKSAADSIPIMNKSLFKASLVRSIQSQDILERYILKACKFNWIFHITKREKKMVFLFKKKDTGAFNIMKMSLDFSMAPTQYPSFEKTPTQFIWTPPSFIISDKKRIQALAKKFKVKASDCILLDMGVQKEKLLLVAFQKGKKTVFHYTSKQAEKSTGDFTKNMLFDFCKALKHGMQNDFKGDEILRLSLNKDNELQTIIHQIHQSYEQMAFLSRLERQDKTWLRHGTIQYKIKDFIANVTLRLKEDGTLAWDYAKNDPFQMQMKLSIQQLDQESIVQLATFPPDFLTGGALHQKLMDAVFEQADTRIMSNQDTADLFSLEREEKESISTSEMEEEENRQSQTPLEVITEKFTNSQANWNKDIVLNIFEQRRKEGALIFRIGRKRKYDTNLFVLIGKVGTATHALIFQGKFKVRFNDGEPEVSLLRKSSIKVLYNARYQPINDGHQVEKYFKKLIWFLKKWADLID